MAETTTAKNTELTAEIATTKDGRDITRGYVNGLPILPPTDSVLQLKGAGDYKVYMEVLRDDEVKAAFGQRVRAVIARPWEVQPGGKKRQDKNAAEFVKTVVDSLNFDAITEKMLHGVFYGYSVGEPIWAVENNQWVVTDIKVRDRRRFAFNPDMELRLKTMQNPLGEPLPEYKFWHFATGADHDDEPYGIGLAHWLYWPVFFKRGGVEFWLKFLDKFGTPTLKGAYPSGTSEKEQDNILDALRAIQHDSAIVIPEGTVVEVLEAARSGTADYNGLVKLMNDAINKVIIGQTASSSGTPGKLGNEELQGDVRLDIVKADADLICMSFNMTIVKWLVDFNFPEGTAYPQLWRTVEEPDDLKARSERDKNIAEIGFKPTLQYIQDTYGGEWEEKQSETAEDPNANTDNPAFAEGELFSDQVALDAAIDALSPEEITKSMDDLLAPVIQLISNKSNEEVLDALAEQYPEMDSAALEDKLANALFASAVWGRLNGKD